MQLNPKVRKETLRFKKCVASMFFFRKVKESLGRWRVEIEIVIKREMIKYSQSF